jgi:hypothetical protein
MCVTKRIHRVTLDFVNSQLERSFPCCYGGWLPRFIRQYTSWVPEQVTDLGGAPYHAMRKSRML